MANESPDGSSVSEVKGGSGGEERGERTQPFLSYCKGEGLMGCYGHNHHHIGTGGQRGLCCTR